MKIFEIREFSFGDYSDRGYVVGYVKDTSKEEAEAKYKKSNWINVNEVSEEDYNARKVQAEEAVKMFIF